MKKAEMRSTPKLIPIVGCVLIAASPVHATDPTAWGALAQIVGKDIRRSEGGFLYKWSWVAEGAEMREEVFDRAGKLNHQGRIHRGDVPGELIRYSTFGPNRAWKGLVLENGDVCFDAPSFFPGQDHCISASGDSVTIRSAKVTNGKLLSVSDEPYFNGIAGGGSISTTPAPSTSSGAPAAASASAKAADSSKGALGVFTQGLTGLLPKASKPPKTPNSTMSDATPGKADTADTTDSLHMREQVATTTAPEPYIPKNSEARAAASFLANAWEISPPQVHFDDNGRSVNPLGSWHHEYREPMRINGDYYRYESGKTRDALKRWGPYFSGLGTYLGECKFAFSITPKLRRDFSPQQIQEIEKRDYLGTEFHDVYIPKYKHVSWFGEDKMLPTDNIIYPPGFTRETFTRFFNSSQSDVTWVMDIRAARNSQSVADSMLSGYKHVRLSSGAISEEIQAKYNGPITFISNWGDQMDYAMSVLALTCEKEQ